MAERWDLYDAFGAKTGASMERGRPVPKGLYHLVASAWIVNPRGEVLLSQRHPGKPYPLYWECTGGAVLAGESSLAGAVREVGEELGLDLDPGAGRLVCQRRREALRDLYDVWLFEADAPASAIRLQEGEVIAAQWVDREALWRLFREHRLHPLLGYMGELFPLEGA